MQGIVGFKKKLAENNAATISHLTKKENHSKEEWNISALLAVEEEINLDNKNSEKLVESPKVEVALTATYQSIVDYNKDWIIDSSCSNHMTGDKEKLESTAEYKGNRVVVIAGNSMFTFTLVGEVVISPSCRDNHVHCKTSIMCLE